MTTATYDTAFEQIKSFLYQKGTSGLKEADTNSDDYVVKQEFAQYVINNITEWNGLESNKEDIISQFYNNFNNKLINPNGNTTSGSTTNTTGGNTVNGSIGGGNIPDPNSEYTCTWPNLKHTAFYNNNTTTPETYTPTITRTNIGSNNIQKLKPTVSLSLAGGNRCSLVNFDNGSFTINPNDIKAGTYNFTIVMKVDGQQVSMKTYSVVVTKKQTETSATTAEDEDIDDIDDVDKTEEVDETDDVEESEEVEEPEVKKASSINPTYVDWKSGDSSVHLEAYGVGSTNNGKQITAVDFGTLYSSNAVINLHQATQTDTQGNRDNDKSIVTTRILQLGEYIVNAIANSTTGYSYDRLCEAASYVLQSYLAALSIPANGGHTSKNDCSGSFIYRGRNVDQRNELTKLIQNSGDTYKHGIYAALDTAEDGAINGYNYMVSFQGLVNDILTKYDELLG